MLISNSWDIMCANDGLGRMLEQEWYDKGIVVGAKAFISRLEPKKSALSQTTGLSKRLQFTLW